MKKHIEVEEFTEQEITEEISNNVLHLTRVGTPTEVMWALVVLTDYYREHVYRKYQERLLEPLEHKGAS